MKVGLFIPCYINAIYPQVGVASYKLLKNLGVDVDYPLDQTCCGQPMANAGFQDESLKMAIRFDDLFRKYDYIVGPSASCVAFVKENHPGILAKEGHQCQSAGKIYDLCAFIHDVIKPTKIPARFPHKVSIHNSCHGVRELFLSAPSELNIPFHPSDKDCARAKGKVILTFRVDKEGRPQDITVKKGLCASADEEAIRLIEEGPDWTMGEEPVEISIRF